MYEVEAILNSRPLTKVSDDLNDLQAFSPNHLLLLRTEPECSPGIFAKNDQLSQKRWRQVQYLSDVLEAVDKRIFALVTEAYEVVRASANC